MTVITRWHRAPVNNNTGVTTSRYLILYLVFLSLGPRFFADCVLDVKRWILLPQPSHFIRLKRSSQRQQSGDGGNLRSMPQLSGLQERGWECGEFFNWQSWVFLRRITRCGPNTNAAAGGDHVTMCLRRVHATDQRLRCDGRKFRPRGPGAALPTFLTSDQSPGNISNECRQYLPSYLRIKTSPHMRRLLDVGFIEL